jgi:iron(II)-dependent oxidoreductase
MLAIILLFAGITIYAIVKNTQVHQQREIALQQKATAQAASTDAAGHRATAESASTVAISQKQTAEAERLEAYKIREQSIANLEALVANESEHDRIKETVEYAINQKGTAESERDELMLTLEAERSRTVEPTPTRTLTFVIIATIPMATPTPAFTPTPDLDATARSQAQLTQLAQAKATQKAVELQLAKATQEAEAVVFLTKGMVKIPAGPFQMGFQENTGNVSGFTVTPEPDELPPRSVTLPEFWVDKTEVSNIDYRLCVDAEVCNPQSGGDMIYHNDSAYNDYPVVNISWYDAKTYCEWWGGRLPTEAEWEKAARGVNGNVWAWGNILKDNLAKPVERANVKDGYYEGPQKAQAYQVGASPYGALNMTGNVWEWVADWYSPTSYQNRPEFLTGPSEQESNGMKVIRGGSYRTFAIEARTDERNALPPEQYSDEIGFRCAVSF